MKSFKRKQIRLGTAAFVLAAVFGLTALFSPAHAVTGGLCVATCLVMKGTVADGVSRVKRSAVEQIVIEHPSGTLAVELSVIGHGPDLTFVYGGVVRTARRLFEGRILVPSSVWDGKR